MSRTRCVPPHNHPGAHFLNSRRVAEDLVRSAGPSAGEIVLDLGAGVGAITAPLVSTGARVIAVERDPRRVGSLTARFAGADVRVVHGDIRTVPLPRRPYRVVASIPFAISTAILRRLLDPPVAPLLGADLVVEWGLARRLTQPCPRDLGVAWWAARYELRHGRRIPAECFHPPPAVDAAHLLVRPRTGVDRGVARGLWALLSTSYAAQGARVGAVLHTFASNGPVRHALAAAGLTASSLAGEVTAQQWYLLGVALSRTQSVRWPPLPRRLRSR